MIRGVLFFLIMWAVITGGINIVRGLTGREALDIIKCVVYGLVTAMLSFGLILLMVVLF